MANTGEVEVDMVFLGLTRPAMFFGVTYLFAMANFFLILMGFIVFNQGLKTFLFAVPIHLVGYYFTAKEPLFMELFFIKQNKCSRCKNRMYHGFTNSYDVA